MDYHDIFSSKKLEDWYVENCFNIDLNVDEKNVRSIICSFDMFLAYNRLSIINSLKRCLDNPDEDYSRNFYSIREKLKEAGGKCVKLDDGTEAYFLGATSTDEDYYYIYIDAEYNISCDSCVGKHAEVLSYVPKGLKKFVECTEEKVSQKVFDAIVKRMWDEPEVFFTPIYFDFIDKYAVSRLEMMSMILKEE